MRDPHDLDERVTQLRHHLNLVRPDLADLPITLALHTEQSNPDWQRASAFVGDRWVAKFAWTEPAARRLRAEIALRRALVGHDPQIPVPTVVASADDPPLLISRFVPGSPLTGAAIATLEPDEQQRLAGGLAATLRALHAPRVLALVHRSGLTLAEPTPQADTEALRRRFPRLVDARRAAMVRRWADWVDAVLGGRREPAVVLHGDFHGHNLVLDEHHTVAALLDLEEAGIGDRHYDFRYLPAQEATLTLFLAVVHEYERGGGSSIDPRRVMAWHLRTVLGDGLWRTEAGVALPEGGALPAWVDQLHERLETLGIRV
jgi:aminoglycoside phosphotransferase (APT) family kinase protein